MQTKLTRTERNRLALALKSALDVKLHKLFMQTDSELIRLYKKYC